MKTLFCLLFCASLGGCMLTIGEQWTCHSSSVVFGMCNTSRTAYSYNVAADLAIEECQSRCLTVCRLDGCY